MSMNSIVVGRGIWLDEFGDFGEAGVRDGDDAGVGVDGAEGIVGGLCLAEVRALKIVDFPTLGGQRFRSSMHCVLFPCYEACFGVVVCL